MARNVAAVEKQLRGEITTLRRTVNRLAMGLRITKQRVKILENVGGKKGNRE